MKPNHPAGQQFVPRARELPGHRHKVVPSPEIHALRPRAFSPRNAWRTWCLTFSPSTVSPVGLAKTSELSEGQAEAPSPRGPHCTGQKGPRAARPPKLGPPTSPALHREPGGARAPVPGSERCRQDPGRDKIHPKHTHNLTPGTGSEGEESPPHAMINVCIARICCPSNKMLGLLLRGSPSEQRSRARAWEDALL